MMFTIKAEKQNQEDEDKRAHQIIFNVTKNTTLIRIVRSDGRGVTQAFALDTLALLDNFDEARREREAEA